MPSTKKPKGRPSKLEMPTPIEADADTVAELVLKVKPKEVWLFEEEYRRKYGTLPR